MIEFVTGNMQQFVATRDFALNFDDPKVTPSVKIKEGQVVEYDGVNARCSNRGGIVSGRCNSLKAAINSAQWLVAVKLPEDETDAFSADMREADESTDEFSDLLKRKEPIPNDPVDIPEAPASSSKDFDGLRGGSFDTYAAGNNGDIHVVPPPGSQKSKVILEKDIIVKEFNTKKDATEEGSDKLEVAGDQVSVKEVGAVVVSSSTAVARQQKKRNSKIVRADEMGAEGTIPLKKSKAASEKTPEKKNSYIVDDATPRTISEDMTRDEVQRLTKVVNADESQDAQVVGTIKQDPKVKEVDGITLRKIDSPKDVSLKKVSSPKDMTVTTKVGSGSTSVEDPTGRTATGSQVKEDSEESDPKLKAVEEAEAKKAKEEAAKKAKERAEARKKSSSTTQKLMEGEKENVPSKKATSKKFSRKKSSPKVVKKTEELDDTDNYLLMLPDDWAKLHWVKKEQFIKELRDVGFIKFILSVETINAVQKACVERLKELEQEAAD